MCSSGRAKRWKSILNRDVTPRVTAWFKEYAVGWRFYVCLSAFIVQMLISDIVIKRLIPADALSWDLAGMQGSFWAGLAVWALALLVIAVVEATAKRPNPLIILMGLFMLAGGLLEYGGSLYVSFTMRAILSEITSGLPSPP